MARGIIVSQMCARAWLNQLLQHTCQCIPSTCRCTLGMGKCMCYPVPACQPSFCFNHLSGFLGHHPASAGIDCDLQGFGAWAMDNWWNCFSMDLKTQVVAFSCTGINFHHFF